MHRRNFLALPSLAVGGSFSSSQIQLPDDLPDWNRLAFDQLYATMVRDGFINSRLLVTVADALDRNVRDWQRVTLDIDTLRCKRHGHLITGDNVRAALRRRAVPVCRACFLEHKVEDEGVRS